VSRPMERVLLVILLISDEAWSASLYCERGRHDRGQQSDSTIELGKLGRSRQRPHRPRKT
jgi:hypothetical protein